MGYIQKEYYAGIYGDIADDEFANFSWEACRLLDSHTTGIDGIKKLKIAFPTDEDDAETVKRCACKLVNLLLQIRRTENASNSVRGYEATENGIRGKVISSVSAGNESISYSTSASAATVIDKAVTDKTVRDSLISATIREYLSGIADANGVSLLYMGPYPKR